MIQFDLRIVLQMACFKPPTTNKFKQSAAGDFGITGRDAEIAGFLTPKKSGLPKKDFWTSVFPFGSCQQTGGLLLKMLGMPRCYRPTSCFTNHLYLARMEISVIYWNINNKPRWQFAWQWSIVQLLTLPASDNFMRAIISITNWYERDREKLGGCILGILFVLSENPENHTTTVDNPSILCSSNCTISKFRKAAMGNEPPQTTSTPSAASKTQATRKGSARSERFGCGYVRDYPPQLYREANKLL